MKSHYMMLEHKVKKKTAKKSSCRHDNIYKIKIKEYLFICTYCDE